MTEPVVRISFPARAEYLVLARLALSGATRHLDIDDQELGDLKLAVTEACGNVVKHAYADGDGSVDVAFVVGDEQIVMIVEDQGAGITATEPRSLGADLSGPLESGMGLAIIHAIVDEYDVEPGSDGGGTVVRMTKRLSSGERRS